jgi:hypothetical protein
VGWNVCYPFNTTSDGDSNVAKETDPVKRAELHAARSHLLVLERGLSMARLHANEGGNVEAGKQIQKARELVNVAMNELVESLAVN